MQTKTYAFFIDSEATESMHIIIFDINEHTFSLKVGRSRAIILQYTVYVTNIL